MKYILMINVPRGTGAYEHGEWAPGTWQAHLDYWKRLNGALAASGELVGVEALAAPAESRVVRAGRGGAPVVTDGPYSESKEFLAGYWIVDVADADRAYAIAAEASAAPGPTGAPLGMPIEVRPVLRAPTP